ncbi:surface antigen [Lewinella marina]|uniref:CHAP domain-containing protein n=1 Tax=Neolewinella marina TaxID=438751 RepID=A0A2G0CKI0_9BACT|nr:CHAP domain-containing protein [Neolewinella marina]NJB84325.1 surface antigen [Neolewinella marina]PHL00475.1 CHAP domain-containing protein [Neolewinella marina]
MKTFRILFFLFALLLLGVAGLLAVNHTVVSPGREVGQQVDQLNGVAVYYNGRVGNVTGRNTTADGYNLGLKYQCVEFVKRYYYEHLDHRMPDSYGHARDFFDPSLADGSHNARRNLTQYTNPGQHKPRVDDLLVFAGTLFNKYGHVAIVSRVADDEIEIIQQNPGPQGSSRATFALRQQKGKWSIANDRIVGWLRKE